MLKKVSNRYLPGLTNVLSKWKKLFWKQRNGLQKWSKKYTSPVYNGVVVVCVLLPCYYCTTIYFDAELILWKFPSSKTTVMVQRKFTTLWSLQIGTRPSGKRGNQGKPRYPSHPWNKQTAKGWKIWILLPNEFEPIVRGSDFSDTLVTNNFWCPIFRWFKSL